MKRRLSRRASEALLAAVIVARSTSLLLLKLGLEDMGTLTLTALRFTVASAILLALFHRRVRAAGADAARRGALIGAVFFLVIVSEVTALRYTPTSTTSFLENTSVVIVPLALAAWRRRLPRAAELLSAALCLGGVALLTLGGGSGRFGLGEALCVLTAFLYAGAIILTDRMSHSGADPLAMGIAQVCAIAALAWAAALLFEGPEIPVSARDWGIILALAAVCTCFGFTLQPVAQSGTSAGRAAMFCALSPLSASALGVIFLHEPLTGAAALGAALILAGLLLPNAPGARKDRPS